MPLLLLGPPIISIPSVANCPSGQLGRVRTRRFRPPLYDMWFAPSHERHQLCGVLGRCLTSIHERPLLCASAQYSTGTPTAGKDSPRSLSCARTAPVCKMARFVPLRTLQLPETRTHNDAPLRRLIGRHAVSSRWWRSAFFQVHSLFSRVLPESPVKA